MPEYKEADRIEFAHIEIGEQFGLIVSSHIVQDEVTGELGMNVVMHSWSDAPVSLGTEMAPIHQTRCGLDTNDEVGSLPTTLSMVSKTCPVCKVTEEELAQANALIEAWKTK